VNKVILVGKAGQNPEVKYTASGVPVANVSLATNERFKDRNDQWQDRTEWHSVVAWQRLAEIVGEYVRKGSKLYIEGKLQTSTWEDKQSGKGNTAQRSSPGTLFCWGHGTVEKKEDRKNLTRSRLTQELQTKFRSDLALPRGLRQLVRQG
jgi:single stranded DNA-binding protein